ncbi:hypothetical protein HZS_4430, partial [Henneguya salminicola]
GILGVFSDLRIDRYLFLVEVLDRTDATLLSIIMTHVRPGPFIMTDCFKSYNSMPDIYTNYTLNSSAVFQVDAQTQSKEPGMKLKQELAQEIEPHLTEKMESRIRMELTTISQSFSGGGKIAPTHGMALLML